MKRSEWRSVLEIVRGGGVTTQLILLCCFVPFFQGVGESVSHIWLFFFCMCINSVCACGDRNLTVCLMIKMCTLYDHHKLNSSCYFSLWLTIQCCNETLLFNKCLNEASSWWFNAATSLTCGGCIQLWSSTMWWWRDPRIQSWSCLICLAHQRTRKETRIVSFFI